MEKESSVSSRSWIDVPRSIVPFVSIRLAFSAQKFRTVEIRSGTSNFQAAVTKSMCVTREKIIPMRCPL